MPVVTSEERLGTILDAKYRLDRILGEGGMGVVFAGMHTRLQVPVAVKFLHPHVSSSAEAVHRFVREAQAAARLSHPNVVAVRDVDTSPDGAVYMVLELLDGESLAEHLARVGRLSVQSTLAIVTPAMDALAAAHEVGIVHRDIKPDNLFLSRGPGGERVTKVLDFGIAKLADAGTNGRTSTGAVIGTPAYMAPEQAMGSKELGPPADVWSMGVVLYECLAGRMHLDFPSDTSAMGLVLAVLTETPISLGVRCPELPSSLVQVIDRALTKDPAQRYPTMREFLTALRATQDGTLPAGAAQLAVRTSSSPPTSSRPAGSTGPLGEVIRGGSEVSRPAARTPPTAVHSDVPSPPSAAVVPSAAATPGNATIDGGPARVPMAAPGSGPSRPALGAAAVGLLALLGLAAVSILLLPPTETALPVAAAPETPPAPTPPVPLATPATPPTAVDPPPAPAALAPPAAPPDLAPREVAPLAEVSPPVAASRDPAVRSARGGRDTLARGDGEATTPPPPSAPPPAASPPAERSPVVERPVTTEDRSAGHRSGSLSADEF